MFSIKTRFFRTSVTAIETGFASNPFHKKTTFLGWDKLEKDCKVSRFSISNRVLAEELRTITIIENKEKRSCANTLKDHLLFKSRIASTGQNYLQAIHVEITSCLQILLLRIKMDVLKLENWIMYFQCFDWLSGHWVSAIIPCLPKTLNKNHLLVFFYKKKSASNIYQYFMLVVK